MDIEKQLDKIMEQYGISYYCYYKDSLAEIIEEILQEMVEKYGTKIIIRGLKKSNVGEYPILSLIEKKAEVVGVVDKAPFAQRVRFLGKQGEKTVPFRKDDVEIKKEDCDIYLINTLYHGKNIYYEVKKHMEAKGIGVIDLYKVIRVKYSMAPSKLYEEYDGERDFSYNQVWYSVNSFRANRTQENLKKLLGVCLYLRDFTSFFRYVEEGKKIIEKSEELQKLVKEVQEFLKEIKVQIQAREKKMECKDVIVHWIDQISYSELSLMPKLQERIKKGLFFENAYAVTPYTRPVARMIFWKEFRGIADENFRNRNGEYEEKTLEDSGLYKKIRQADYDFQVCGYVKQILEQEAVGTEMCEFSVATTVHYFQMANKLLNTTKPIFGIVHILNETHEPYISPEAGLENKSFEFQAPYEESEDKIQISATYADEMMDFYAKLLGDKMIGIYMSDHGKWEDIDRRRYKDMAMRTILGITNIGMKGQVERVFSYQYFLELVDWVLKMAKPETMFFNDLPIYSEGFKAAIRERTEDVMEIYSGYKGVNTSIDKYVQLDNGEEYYFLKSEHEKSNHIHNMKYRERVDTLREQCQKLEEKLYTNKSREQE